MKKKIYILYAIAAMMASCSQDVIEGDAVYEGEPHATLPELDYFLSHAGEVFNYHLFK